jgi:phospholipid/cholesterol/gamma-HCH transport system substrate-binding protein
MRDPGLRTQHGAEVQVGVLVLVSIIALVWGVVWLSGSGIGGGSFAFAVFTPNAQQMTPGSRVYLHGVDVGSVDHVGLAEGGVVLDVSVSQTVTLPRDSKALIQSSGFLGTQTLVLEPGKASQPLAAGDTIAAVPAPDLQTMAGSLGKDAQSVLDRTRRLLADSVIAAMHSSAEDLSGTMHDLRGLVDSERQTLASLIESLDKTSSQLAGATSGPELQETLVRIDSLTGRLHETSKGLDASSRSLASILAKVDGGQGSLGKLVNDANLYDKVTAAAENIQSASEEIALLTKDIRERPERYLKGLKFSVF